MARCFAATGAPLALGGRRRKRRAMRQVTQHNIRSIARVSSAAKTQLPRTGATRQVCLGRCKVNKEPQEQAERSVDLNVSNTCGMSCQSGPQHGQQRSKKQPMPPSTPRPQRPTIHIGIRGSPSHWPPTPALSKTIGITTRKPRKP
jgi:hypothetical protein